MAAVVTRLRDTLESTMKDLEHRVEGLEERARQGIDEISRHAKGSLDEVKGTFGDVPVQLRGAWDRVLGQIRSGLDVATREDIDALGRRLDEIAHKLDTAVVTRVDRLTNK